MVAVKDQLVLVGGMGSDDRSIKALGAWNSDAKKWTHPYPDMITVRAQASAVVYQHWLVIAGGVVC